MALFYLCEVFKIVEFIDSKREIVVYRLEEGTRGRGVTNQWV